MKRRIARSGGFTLAESLMASAVLVVIVAAVTQAVTAGQAHSRAASHSQYALMLADEMIERILALPYNDPDGGGGPGPEPGESQIWKFDNADDFHGYSQSGSGMQDAAKKKYPSEFDRFSRSVTAVYGTVTVSGYSQPVEGLTITVTITDDKGRTWTLSRFIQKPQS